MRMFRRWFQRSKWLPRLSSVLPKSSVLLCAFLWAKGLSAKDIHKEMFPICCGKCLSRKAVHNWVQKFSQGRSKVADDARPGRHVETATEATVLRVEELIRADRRITIDSVAMLVEDMSRNKCFSQIRISHVLRFISICDLFTDSPS
jgi:hypothetical protein